MDAPDMDVHLRYACTNCKEAYMGDGQSPVSSGFNVSIVFMMIMPFLVMGGFALRLWLAQRHRESGSFHDEVVPSNE